MSVVPFRRKAQARTYSATEIDRATVRKSAVSQVIDDLYYYAPEQLRQCAAMCAHDCIQEGGGFLDAMDAAALMIKAAGIEPYAPSTELQRQAAEEARNAIRMARYMQNRSKLQADRLARAAQIIRRRLQDRPGADVEAAIKRAERVIERGGLVYTAVYRAIGTDMFL